MAFNILYRRLLEVHIMHPYYFLDENVSAFYQLDRSGRIDKLSAYKYDISQDIQLVPTKKCQTIMGGHKMRYKMLSTGLMIGIEVEEKSLNGDIVYQPIRKFDEGLSLQFRMVIKNPTWGNYSNLRFKPNFPANFYFSNVDIKSNLTFPSLAVDAEDYNMSRIYEMGEVVTFNNKIYKAEKNIELAESPDAADNNWKEINDFQIVNDNCRYLLPMKFPYHFSTDQVISEATFTLFRLDDSEVKKIEMISSNAQNPFDLDFALLPNQPVNQDPELSKTPPGLYKLQVEGTGGYQDSKIIYLDDELYHPGDFGLVNLKHRNSIGEFRLLEDGGHLRQNGTSTETPILDIRMQNRSTYWEFVFPKSQVLDPDPTVFKVTTDSEFKRLESKSPAPLSINAKHIEYDDQNNSNSEKVKLPTPNDLMIQPRKNGKIYSEIFVNKLN